MVIFELVMKSLTSRALGTIYWSIIGWESSFKSSFWKA